MNIRLSLYRLALVTCSSTMRYRIRDYEMVGFLDNCFFEDTRERAQCQRSYSLPTQNSRDVGWLVVLRLNVPVNNFSVISGRSHRFLGN